jgi:hypothetical protein
MTDLMQLVTTLSALRRNRDVAADRMARAKHQHPAQGLRAISDHRLAEENLKDFLLLHAETIETELAVKYAEVVKAEDPLGR